jgi:ClpP class serine protease
MWVFTASDELYATPVTDLGSIGVKVAFELDDESKTITMVSRSAPNKTCDINGDCADRIQAKIDETEDEFFRVMEENTGFKKEALVELFNAGDTVKAEVAQKAGFIKEVLHFKPLMSRLTSSTVVANAAVPTAQESDKPAKQIQGENMTDKEIMASEPYSKLVASHEEQVKAMQSKMDEVNASLKAMQDKAEAQEAWSKQLPEVCAMAIERNVSQDTLVAMVTAGDVTKAKAAVADGMTSEGAFGATETEEASVEEDNKKVFDDKAKALDITFIGGSK